MNVLRSFVGIPLLALVFVESLSGAESLSLVRTIDLPRVEGRIDHMAIDIFLPPLNDRLPVAFLIGANPNDGAAVGSER